MAEQPDGGRDAAGESARRVDWDALQPAVRRVGGDPPPGGEPGVPDDEPSAVAPERATGGVDGGDAADDRPADRHPVDDDRLGDWRDLEPAVRPADGTDDEGDDHDWEHRSLTPPDLEDETSSPATNPEVLAEQSKEDVISPETAPAPAGGGFGMDAPESDEEAPLAVHVEEMVKRLGVVIAIAGLVSVAVFPLTESLITTIWNQVLPGQEAVDPRVYHPLELVITQIKVASLAGLVVAMPVFVYESYAFMRPGLYKHERRYYLAAVPTSLVLAVLGVLFAFLLVLPITMDYFQGYTQGTADVAFALGSTFNLILLVMGYLAVVFQIPLFIMLAIMLGVVTRRWLEERRLLFWAAFAGISFSFGAIDPTGVVPIIVAITMIVLFEGTLALLRWTGN